jgi:hypothetical protein
VGLRLVADRVAIEDPERITAGRIEVEFDVVPASITESITPAGRQVEVSWTVAQVEARVTIAAP